MVLVESNYNAPPSLPYRASGEETASHPPNSKSVEFRGEKFSLETMKNKNLPEGWFPLAKQKARPMTARR